MMRCPGIEPGSTAWKAAMLTTIPTSLNDKALKKIDKYCKILGLTTHLIVRFDLFSVRHTKYRLDTDILPDQFLFLCRFTHYSLFLTISVALTR